MSQLALQKRQCKNVLYVSKIPCFQKALCSLLLVGAKLINQVNLVKKSWLSNFNYNNFYQHCVVFNLWTFIYLKGTMFTLGFHLTGGHLTKIHLIEIVFFQLIKSFIISWPNFLRLFSLEKFDQLPKKNLRILAVDRNFNNVILSYFKLWIKCQKITCKFFHLIESFLINLN